MNDGDTLAVNNAVAAYCQAYDDRDRGGLEAVVGEDCVLDLVGGRFDGQSFAGRRAIVDWLVETWPVTPPCLHLTGNVRLEERTDEVVGTTDYVFFVQRQGTFEISGRGRYLDVFRREGSAWVLARRTVWQPS